MKPELLLIAQQISLQADLFYSHGERFGGWMASACGHQHRAQITNLENVANSAHQVSDVLDYLKKQTAKSRPGSDWRDRDHDPAGSREGGDEGEGRRDLGTAALHFVAGALKERCEEVCRLVAAKTGNDVPPLERQRIYVNLIREFVRQAAAHFEYQSAGGADDDAQA